jgi:hypothetical protein
VALRKVSAVLENLLGSVGQEVPQWEHQSGYGKGAAFCAPEIEAVFLQHGFEWPPDIMPGWLGHSPHHKCG